MEKYVKLLTSRRVACLLSFDATVLQRDILHINAPIPSYLYEM